MSSSPVLGGHDYSQRRHTLVLSERVLDRDVCERELALVARRAIQDEQQCPERVMSAPEYVVTANADVRCRSTSRSVAQAEIRDT